MSTASGSATASRPTRSTVSGRNGCPEYPGWMPMQSTRSAARDTAATGSGSVSGFTARPRLGLGMKRAAGAEPRLARGGDRRLDVVHRRVVERDAVPTRLGDRGEVL